MAGEREQSLNHNRVTEALSSDQNHNTLQKFFLLRLGRIVEKRKEYGIFPECNFERKLLDKAIYSTFCDCLEQEVGEEARGLLRGGSCARTTQD